VEKNSEGERMGRTKQPETVKNEAIGYHVKTERNTIGGKKEGHAGTSPQKKKKNESELPNEEKQRGNRESPANLDKRRIQKPGQVRQESTRGEIWSRGKTNNHQSQDRTCARTGNNLSKGVRISTKMAGRNGE